MIAFTVAHPYRNRRTARKGGIEDDSVSVFAHHASQPWFWVEAFCFFLLATPFELEIGSGFGYAIKAAAVTALVLPRLISGTARLGPIVAFVMIIAGVFLLANAGNITQRALFASALMILGAIVGQVGGVGWRDRLLALTAVYLAVHLFGFGISLLEFYVRGSVVDLHAMLFPAESRAHAVGAAARLSGFHNEPGTFAQWMLAVAILRSHLSGRIISPFNGAVVLAAMLTLSLWAVLSVGLLMLGSLMELVSRSRSGQRLRATIIFILLLFSGIITLAILPNNAVSQGLGYIASKSALDSQSGINKIYTVRNLEEKLPEVVILGGNLSPGICPTCLSPQDAGMLVNSVYYVGLISTAILVILLYISSIMTHGVKFVPLIIVILVWKAQFYDPFLWLIIGSLLTGVFNKLILSSYSMRTGSHQQSTPGWYLKH